MNNTVLITGASTGIGYALSKVFSRNGYNSVLVSRNHQKLEVVAKELQDQYDIQAKVMPKDLSVPSAPQELYNDVVAAGIDIDVLVNNAAFGINGKFTEFSVDEHLEMLQLNITALTMLCNLFGKDMVKRHSGSILNVASTAGFQAGPLMSTYYASKAYVILFSEGLNKELAQDGIQVSVLCPGVTKTDFFDRADMKTANILKLPGMMSADRVAEICYSGLMRGKKIIIPGIMNKMMAFSSRLGPRSVSASIAHFFNRTE